MPIYDYTCKECNHMMEQMQKMDSPAPEKCPCCEKEGTLKKIPSKGGFRIGGIGVHKPTSHFD